MAKLILALSLLASSSAFAAGAVFSNISIRCDDVDWINLDGSYQCNNPLFIAVVSNGVNTLNINAMIEQIGDKTARAAQGAGICGLLGYMNYLAETTEAFDAYDPSVTAQGPFVKLDNKGTVVSIDKTTKGRLTSVTCK